MTMSTTSSYTRLLNNVRVIGTAGITVIQSQVNSAPFEYNWIFDASGEFTAPRSVVTAPNNLADLTAIAGARAFVNDSTLAAVSNFGAQITGGGANTVPAWSDGTNWYIG